MTSPPFLGRSQLWLAVACVLVLQVLLIFWLGTRQPVRPRATEPWTWEAVLKRSLKN